jgi:hypothetical protein
VSARPVLQTAQAIHQADMRAAVSAARIKEALSKNGERNVGGLVRIRTLPDIDCRHRGACRLHCVPGQAPERTEKTALFPDRRTHA